MYNGKKHEIHSFVMLSSAKQTKQKEKINIRNSLTAKNAGNTVVSRWFGCVWQYTGQTVIRPDGVSVFVREFIVLSSTSGLSGQSCVCVIVVHLLKQMYILFQSSYFIVSL